MWGRRPLALVLVPAAMLLGLSAASAQVPGRPIPENPQEHDSVPASTGKPWHPEPVRSFDVPPHPFMAPNDRSNIHDDAYQTDTARYPGPLGRRTEVTSTFHVAECASLAFDADGRIVTICVGLEGPRLVMMDAETLDTLAVFPLPARGIGGTGTSPFNDFSGGGYFYLDDEGRVVTPTSTREIWVIGGAEGAAGPSFELLERHDLSGAVAPGDSIVSALPDWNGLVWFVSTKGIVGTLDRKTGTVANTRLEGEAIGNSFAVDETGGVYVVSDHALYRFDAAGDGSPKITWRRTYDRGNTLKPGQVTVGSGTTPTVLGGGYVAITDNAEPRMHVLVYRTSPASQGRLVCSEAVFDKDRSATDNSLIAAGRSLIVENNFGYSGPAATENGGTTSGGLARIDFGAGGCETVWKSKEIAPSVVPKLSLANGLVYTYTKPSQKNDADAWYLTALDFRTGKTAFKVLAGTGLGFNNNYAPVTLGPDGSAYVGVLGGLVRLSDARTSRT